MQWWKRLENWNRTRSRSWVSPLSTSAWRKVLGGGRDQDRPRLDSRPRAQAGSAWPPLLPRGAQALPKGPVQALATELEEGQVLLSHSPAEVIAVEGSGDHVWVEEGAGDPGAGGNPRPAHIPGPGNWGWGP